MATEVDPELQTLRTLLEFAQRDAGYADELRTTVRAVEAVVAKARLISPSASMVCYVADVERALGHQAPRPHKLGAPDAHAV